MRPNKAVVVSLFFFLILFISYSCEEDCDCKELLCEDDCACIETADHEIDLSEVEITKVRQYSLQFAIEIDDEEVDSVLELGIVYSESIIPDIENNKMIADTILEENSGTLLGLLPGTTYNIRAYAITKLDTCYSVLLIATTIAEDGSVGTVTDIDGNTYKTLMIGGMQWMVENLRVTHYRDNTPINTNVLDDQWGTIDFGAYGIYPHRKIDGFETDSAVAIAYGALYNWHAVNDERRLSPEGWHIPTDEEWQELEMFLGMSEAQAMDTDMRGSDQGAQIKSTNTLPDPHPSWEKGNVATNSSGFTVISGGARYENGNFGYKGWYASFWTSTEVGTSNAWARTLTYYDKGIGRNINKKFMGYSIRCVKD